MVILDFLFLFWFFDFLSIIFYGKACKELMRWGKLRGVQEQDGPKTQSSKKRKNSCLADPRNCDPRFTSSQRHTQEPHKRNDIFI